MSKLTSSKNSTVLLLTALVAALLFAFYYYLIVPKLDEVEAKNSTVDQLQQEVASIEGQLAKLDEEQVAPVSNLLAMRQKVPATRAIEQVILDMVEIEEVTGTRVESLNFNNYDTAVAQSEVTELDKLEEIEAKVNEEAGSERALPVSAIAKENLPAELKLITFNLEVKALNFEALGGFLEEIEKLERVLKTDTINFTLPGEQEQLQEDADPTLAVTVQVTMFYFEGEK